MSLSKRFLKSCEENNLEEVEECLNQGVDVNTVSEDGKLSGLTIAAAHCNPQMLELLLSQPGIDVNLATTKSNTWMNSLGNWTPLMVACRAYPTWRHEIVRRLVQVPGINITHKDSYRNTALHLAASEAPPVNV